MHWHLHHYTNVFSIIYLYIVYSVMESVNGAQFFIITFILLFLPPASTSETTIVPLSIYASLQSHKI